MGEILMALRNKKGSGWGMKYITIFIVLDIRFFTYGSFYPSGQTTVMQNYATLTPNDNGTMPTPGNAWSGGVNIDNTTMSDLGLNSSGFNSARSGLPPSTTFFNTITLVWKTISRIAGLVFAPIAFLQATRAPLPVVLMLGLVPSVLFILAIVSFIRGKDF